MATIARNASCPCGSGRKYKHCCLVREEAVARAARFEEAVSGRIQDWATRQFDDEIGTALEEYAGSRRRLGDDDLAIFVEWFHTDRELADGATPAERYAARPDLAPAERAAAARIAAARLGLHRVLAVEPGVSLVLEDVVSGGLATVRSQRVSRAAVRWDILLGRVMEGEPQSLWGPTRTFTPAEEPEVLAELERLARSDGRGVDGPSPARAFRTHALALMRFTPPSRLAERSFFTLEGDPVAFSTAVWHVRDLGAVTDMLRALGDLRPDEPVEIDITVPRESLLAQCPVLPPGAVILEAEPIDLPATTSIATLRLEGGQLRAEAISEQRLAYAIQVVTDDFGPVVELRERHAGSVADSLASRDAPPRQTSWAEEDEDLEERQLLDEVLAARMRRWPDEPLPALGGRTPRDVAAGEERDKVVRLVRQLENAAERSRREGRPAVEMGWLWGELGLDDLLAA